MNYFILRIQLAAVNKTPALLEIGAQFCFVCMQDQHLNVIQLDVPRDSISIGDMFQVLEQEKANYNIMYYTVSQITLDTVSSLWQNYVNWQNQILTDKACLLALFVCFLLNSLGNLSQN